MALARDALLRRIGRLIRLMGVRRVNPISFDRRRHGIDPQALHHAIADQFADGADPSPIMGTPPQTVNMLAVAG